MLSLERKTLLEQLGHELMVTPINRCHPEIPQPT